MVGEGFPRPRNLIMIFLLFLLQGLPGVPGKRGEMGRPVKIFRVYYAASTGSPPPLLPLLGLCWWSLRPGAVCLSALFLGCGCGVGYAGTAAGLRCGLGFLPLQVSPLSTCAAGACGYSFASGASVQVLVLVASRD